MPQHICNGLNKAALGIRIGIQSIRIIFHGSGPRFRFRSESTVYFPHPSPPPSHLLTHSSSLTPPSSYLTAPPLYVFPHPSPLLHHLSSSSMLLYPLHVFFRTFYIEYKKICTWLEQRDKNEIFVHPTVV